MCGGVWVGGGGGVVGWGGGGGGGGVTGTSACGWCRQREDSDSKEGFFFQERGRGGQEAANF